MREGVHVTRSDNLTHTTPQRASRSGLGLWFARAPRHLYHARLGWILTRRFVLIEHVGRKTGRARETVLEVIHRDDASLYVAAAHGPTSDWYRNLAENQHVRVSTGRLRRVPAIAAPVDEEEARDLFARYAREHAVSARFLAKALDIPTGDPRIMAATIPLVRINPAPDEMQA